MRTALKLLAVGVLTSCVDFDAARSRCLERGGCISSFENPTLTASVPANQAAMVAVGTSLSLTFSKPMDSASVGRPTIAPPVVLSDPQWSSDGTSFVVQPLVPLAHATTYTVTVTGRSTEGASLSSGTSFSFTTANAPDTAGPTLASSTPANGLQGVDVTTRLSLTFSEPVDRASLDVTAAPPVALGAGTWDTEDRTVTFADPLDPWQPNTTYIVQLSATDKTRNPLQGARSISFKTSQPTVVDTTAPVVVATLPSSAAMGVDVTTNISVTFSEAVRPAGATLLVSPDAGCAAQLDVTNTRLSCNNLSALAPLTPYTVTVPTSVTDVAGNPLAQPFTFQFQSGTAPDTTRPTVVLVAPDGGSGFPVRQSMVAVFSEPMDQASAQAAFAVTNPALTAVFFGWSADSRTMTATPTTDFPYLQTVTWQLGAGTADTSGNTLGTTQQYSFGVVPDTVAPTVVSNTPMNAATNVDVKVNFAVTFSEPMSAASAAFQTTPDAGCVAQFDSTRTRMSCNNSNDLQGSTTYLVTVPTTVQDSAGNRLAQPFTYQFTTGIVADTTRPTVVGATAADGGSGFALRQPMTVQFSEPMDQASVQSAFAFVSPVGATATYFWSGDGQTMTATPTADMAYGQLVTWQIGSGAQDLAGNSLLSAQSFSYRVRRITTGTIAASESGYTGNGVNQGTGMFVGDNFSNQNYRAFLVYSLPPTAIDITSATLTLKQCTSSSFPFSTGSAPLAVYVESIPYTPGIDNDEAVAAPACLASQPQQCVALVSRCSNAELVTSASASTCGEARTVGPTSKMTAMIRYGLSRPNRTFALRFRRGYLSSSLAPCDEYFNDGDGQGDYFRFLDPNDGTAANRPVLSITYTYP